MALEAHQSEVQQRVEEEVAELKSQMNSMQNQMGEMMKLLQNMSTSGTPNMGSNQPPLTNGTNPGTTSGARMRIEAVGIPVPNGEGHGFQDYNQGGAYTYEVPNTDPVTTVINPNPIANNTLPRGGESDLRDGLKEEVKEMRGQLQALQGAMTWKSVDLNELCLAPEIPIPNKFKVPDFTKYDGSGDPHYHLKTYCTRMSVWSRDEKFLIHFFHESLTGAALQWFMNLDHSKLRKWSDLTDVFMRNYQFNLNTAPTREQLKGLKRKTGETFKEYTQRWRATASQVQPPLIESELCSYFIGTLGEPYFKIMLGTHVKYFTDLIEVGERIDVNVREGKLENSPLDNKKGQGVKEKESDVSHVPDLYQYPFKRPYTPQYRYPYANPYNAYGAATQPPPYQPRAPFAQSFRHPQPTIQTQPSHQANASLSNRDPKAVRPPRDERPLPNFNVTRSELFRDLVEKKLMGPRPIKPWQPPFPSWYNPNETCEYHMGVEGHSIDRCDAFRRHVLDLLDNNYISIRKDNNPNIVSNPLPEHDKMKQVNAVEEDVTQPKGVDALRFTMREVFEYLQRAGCIWERMEESWVALEHGPHFCEYHQRYADHDIEGCASFKERVRKMMVFGMLKVEQQRPRDNSVCMMGKQDDSAPTDKSKGSLLIVNSPTPVPRINRHELRNENHSLGVALQGMKEPIEVLENSGRQGLGYQPSIELLMAQQMRLHRGKARERLKVPHIRASFPFPSEVISPNSSVKAVDEEEEGGTSGKVTWIQFNVTGRALDNWKSEIIPDIMSLE